jgi:hypothetical protein
MKVKTKTNTGVALYLKYDLAGASKHVFSTDRAVTLQVALDASVVVFQRDHHADITLFAVEKVLA